MAEIKKVVLAYPGCLDTSTVRVNLTNEFKAPITCAEFELFSDEACQKLIDTARTDNNGIAEFAKSLQVCLLYTSDGKYTNP